MASRSSSSRVRIVAEHVEFKPVFKDKTTDESAAAEQQEELSAEEEKELQEVL